MGYTLIICEKPTAAKAIAEALGEKVEKKQNEGEKAFWYEFTKDGKKYVAAPAVGHLFTLKSEKKGWDYPIFDVEWVPSFKANKMSAFSKPYYMNLEKLVTGADNFIVATDYDEEGEVIGYNVLKFICGIKDTEKILRMKFSTMTKEELTESFEKPLKVSKNLVEAGLTRHYLDWYWGINLTRALTLSIKKVGQRFRILSTGRVQGPLLHMLAKHEKKIKAFKPEPFWVIQGEVKIGKNSFPIIYEKDKIWNKKEADEILKKASIKEAIVKNITKKLFVQKPPVPYNTTSLLADIYRYFGYSPQQGLNIAESLYQAGMISYPRTSSEKLPKDIDYKKILKNLAKQKNYTKDIEPLLNKELKPMEGKKTDPAHPAVYPTGIYKNIGDKQKKVYDLIVRRFLATFGESSKRESQKIFLDINGNIFFLTGKRTVEAGWTQLYGKYAQRDEVILPEIKIGDRLSISKIEQIEKETQPPARFSQGSVLKEMEAKNLGTKATRPQILQILYNRGYIVGNSIEVTELGMNLSDILEKNVPDVISEKLTRYFEERTDAIEAGKEKKDDVLEEAKKRITKICNEFKKKENKIGEELTKSVIASQDKQSILGKCNECGGILKVHKNWKTGKRFVGCSGYKKGCRVGFPLPSQGIIMSTDKICEQCKTPIIQVRNPGTRPFRMCLDPNCPTKKDWLDKEKLKAAQIASRQAKSYICDICNKSFGSKRSLSLHKKVHEKNKE